MASSKIKGITVEIGGDTTKLGKALESAEQSSKGLQSELKGVNSLLKLDPSNVELLKQKQDLLSKSIEETENKLTTLKSTQAQVQAQFEKGDITAEQYRDFQREIVATEQKLKRLKDEQKDFGSVVEQQMKAAGKKVEEFGGKIEEAGKKVSGLSVASSAGLVASAKSAADNEKAVNKYIAATGKATTETDKYRAMMEDIYKNNYGESISDVADKMQIVSNILGDLPDDELQKVVEKSYMLEDAYGMDFQENIRGVNSLIDQFGITADQAYELINQGAQKGLNQNQDLTDQIAEYSVYYRQLGFTADEFFNAMLNGAKSGAYQIDYLNDAMKEFGIRVIDGSDGTKQAFEDLGLNAEKTMQKFAMGGDSAQEAFSDVIIALNKVDDSVKYNELGVQLFGTKWEDLGSEAVYAMTDLEQAITSAGNTVESTTDTMYGGASNEAEKAVRSIQTSFASLGNSLLPIIEPIAKKIAELADKFSELSPSVQKVVLVIMGLVAAAGPVLIFVGKVITAVGQIIPLISKLVPIFNLIKTAVSGLFTLIMANPVVAIIVGIVAAIVLLWTKCEWFRDLVTGMFNGLVSIFTGIVDFFKNNWQTILLFILNPFAGVFKLLYDKFEGFRDFVDGIVQAIKDIFFTVVDFIKTNIIDPIVAFFVSLYESIIAIFTPIVEWFTQLFTSIYDTLSSIVEVIIGLLKGVWIIITTVFGIAASWFNEKVIQPIANFFKSLWDGISKAAQVCWDFIKSVFNTVSKWFNDTVIQPVAKFFTGMWDGLKKGAQSAWDGIKSIFGKVADFFGDVFGKAWSKVKSIFSTGGKIFSGITDGILKGFKSIVNTIIGGINNVVSIPFNGINAALRKIRDISFLGISPFKGLIKEISVPQIPKLATGNVSKPNNPYLALLGDNKKEVEVTSPLSTMKEAMMDALTNFSNTRYQNGSSGSIEDLTRLLKQYMPLIVENMDKDILLDGRKVGKTIAPTINKELGIISAKEQRGY